jgi:S1-C subfamily serine protease
MLQETLLQVGDGVVALGRGARRGSGLVVGQDRVVTLRHPLRGDLVEMTIGTRDAREGRLIGIDHSIGVAVFEVETGDAPPPRWASSTPAIGTPVYAFGNPGDGLRITAGAVSAAPLTTRTRRGRRLEVIEHTAPMPRGAGGGPLVDEAGAVLGLNALRVDAGFLLALPAAAVRDAVERVLEGREPTRLGVALASPEAGRRMRTAVGLPERDGLLVRGVEEGSRAEQAGVAAGDLLVALAGVELRTFDDLQLALERAGDRPSADLRVVRVDDERELAIDLTGEAS